MSTPVAAGNAALIHQYFHDRSFWARLCDPTYPLCSKGPFHPSGAMIKALMIHATVPCNMYQGQSYVYDISHSQHPSPPASLTTSLTHNIPYTQYLGQYLSRVCIIHSGASTVGTPLTLLTPSNTPSHPPSNPLFNPRTPPLSTHKSTLLPSCNIHPGASTVGTHLLTSPPDIYQGYGRVQLSMLLPLLPYNAGI